MPRSVIDPVARTIHLRDRAWPFEWEPAAATAAIELGTQRFELRELSWRHKRNLARAAQKLGAGAEEALGALLLEACVAGRADLPSDPDEREALTRLTAWFLADGSSVAWDPAQLARVTLDVCRSAQIAPQALDDMPASDVEALWQVARQEAPPSPPRSPEPDNGGFNRIVIVPDPVEASTRRTTPPEPAHQNSSALPTEQAPTASTATQAEAMMPPRVPPTPVVEPPNPPRRDVQPSRPAAGRVRATRPAVAPRIRVRSLSRPAASPSGPVAHARTVTDVSARPPSVSTPVEAARSEGADVSASARRLSPREGTEAAIASRVSPGPSSVVVLPAGHSGRSRAVAAPDAVEPGLTTDRSASPVVASRPAGSAFPPPDWNPFIDERDPFGDEPAQMTSLLDGDAFADNLERAALDAGVDLET